MLEIAQTNDPRCAVRGTPLVSRRIPFNAEHTLAAACQPLQSSAAHRAKPADDDVETPHRA